MNSTFNPSTNRQVPATRDQTTTYALANGEEIKLSTSTVREYLVRGNGAVSDQEVMMFIALCKSQKLNPFVNDAYLIKYGDRQPASIVVGKGALEKRAELDPDYDGKENGIIVLSENGELEYRQGALAAKGENIVGGWATVYRKDRGRPEHVEVSFDEYVGRKSNGEINGQWATKPATMIQKVAVAQALRQAFPNDLNGMYASEEMDQAQPEPIEMPVSAPVESIPAPAPEVITVDPVQQRFTADDLI